MKRGNILLLIFASSIFFFGIFSFLPMVSANHCGGLSQENCVVDRQRSICVGDQIFAHSCTYDGQDCVNYDEGPYMDCKSYFYNPRYCSGQLGDKIYMMVGECVHYGNTAFCVPKTILLEDCDPDFCTATPNEPAHCQTIQELKDEIKNLLEENSKPFELASLKLGSKPLIFKTALAILLVALVLLVVIYFKPKKKKRK